MFAAPVRRFRQQPLNLVAVLKCVEQEKNSNVVIPECLRIYQIGQNVFYSNDIISSIYIPDSVYELGVMSFGYMDNLSKIFNGKNVKKIDGMAFSGCGKLKDVSSLSSVQELVSCCFSSVGLLRYEMPNNVHMCDNNVFIGCSSLKEVVYSKNLDYVGRGMFNGCLNLERCILNNNITTIKSDAFNDCTSLKQIYLPNSVTKIDVTSFETTTNLYSSNNAPIALGTVSYTQNNSVKSNLSISNVLYPNYKIENCELLEYQSETGYDYTDENEKQIIDVPNTVEKISKEVFLNNRNVDKVILSDYLDVIGEGAFMMSSVEDIKMPQYMSSIGANAFNKATSLTEIVIPEGIETLERNVFFQTRLSGCVIPSTVTEIKSGAFWHCSGLITVYLPNSVDSIESNSFADCNERLVLYGDENAYLSEYVNAYSEQNDNNTIGCRLGYDVSNDILNSYSGTETHIQIPSYIGLVGIAEGVFEDNTIVETVSIASGITSIGEDCFSGCTSLTALVVPEDVASIGNNALNGVQNLTMYCNANSYIEEYCTENNITVNTDFDISDGVLNKYNGTATNVVIPSNLCIAEIGQNAFFRNKTLTNVVIPENTVIISPLAFGMCENLSSVTLPLNSKVRVRMMAFSFCDNLENINNSTSIWKIENYAFSDCMGLESVDLSNVKAILNNAFENCTNLTNVVIGSSAESIGSSAFVTCTNLVINCYADTYAHQYAIDNAIPYVLLDSPTTAVFSLRPSVNLVESTDNMGLEDEDYIAIDPEQELYKYIQQEHNGEVIEDNINDIVTYMVDNGWW